MVNKPFSEKNIQEALNSLDGIKKTEPQPFFYTRLQARITRKERNIWDNITGVIARPSVAICSVLIVILINMAVVLNQTPIKILPDQTDIAILDEYKHSISFYDLENGRP